MSKYKYFTDEEVAGLQDMLALKLDQMRDRAGIPITITCGLRTPEQNLAAGGVSDSAHLKGLAADIACPDGQTRFKLVKAALEVGFKRVEAATAHIHIDIDETLPQDVMWVDVSH